MYLVTYIHVSVIKKTKETPKKSIKLFLLYTCTLNYSMKK